jgi:UDP-2,4-diacetamido-2,4,6-trideoxy-beta-L-altropyranose hydrolase
MRFAIRADASVDIGHGHVTRCLTLATALRAAGGDVLFVCRRLPGDLTDRIEREGFAVRTFVADDASAALDAERTLSSLTTAGPVDWLIVDHYGLSAAWERSVRSHAHRVMVIDDLADRPHDCDLLLDQNIVAQAAARYVGLVPDECPLLLGPQYALLQPAYRQWREQTSVRHGPVSRILIFWGGADRKGLTRRSLAAVISTGATKVAVDVVVTRYSHELEDIRRLAKSHRNVRVHSDLPTLAPLLAEADLAIGAGGTTTWERLCLGVPALVVTVAENQRAIAEEVARRGLIEYLGHHDEVTDERLLHAVRDVLARDLREWSAACRSVVDGAGAERVARVLFLARPRFHVRPVEWTDEALLLDWANDPITRANAFTTARISADEHHAWLSKRLVDPACRMFIVETDAGDPIGQVRFDHGDEGWLISYSVAPEWRGKRLGATMLSTAMRALQAQDPDAAFIGLVKEANRPSRRIFESLGFSARSTPGVVEYRSRP